MSCVLGGWAPRIGDPTLMGWATVAAYFAAAILATLAARRATGRQRAFWIGLAVILLALTVNKQLDLQSALTEAGRCISKAQGWYEARRSVQVIFIEAVLVASALAAAVPDLGDAKGPRKRLARGGGLRPAHRVRRRPRGRLPSRRPPDRLRARLRPDELAARDRRHRDDRRERARHGPYAGRSGAGLRDECRAPVSRRPGAAPSPHPPRRAGRYRSTTAVRYGRPGRSARRSRRSASRSQSSRISTSRWTWPDVSPLIQNARRERDQ